eukprot:SAG31_NODE_35_length_31836_cov_10.841352_32_plen_268_part_00
MRGIRRPPICREGLSLGAARPAASSAASTWRWCKCSPSEMGVCVGGGGGGGGIAYETAARLRRSVSRVKATVAHQPLQKLGRRAGGAERPELNGEDLWSKPSIQRRTQATRARQARQSARVRVQAKAMISRLTDWPPAMPAWPYSNAHAAAARRGWAGAGAARLTSTVSVGSAASFQHRSPSQTTTERSAIAHQGRCCSPAWPRPRAARAAARTAASARSAPPALVRRINDAWPRPVQPCSACMCYGLCSSGYRRGDGRGCVHLGTY